MLNSLRFTWCHLQPPPETQHCCGGHVQTLGAVKIGLWGKAGGNKCWGLSVAGCFQKTTPLPYSSLWIHLSIFFFCLGWIAPFSTRSLYLNAYFFKWRKTDREERILFTFRPLSWNLCLVILLTRKDEHTLASGVPMRGQKLCVLQLLPHDLHCWEQLQLLHQISHFPLLPLAKVVIVSLDEMDKKQKIYTHAVGIHYCGKHLGWFSFLADDYPSQTSIVVPGTFWRWTDHPEHLTLPVQTCKAVVKALAHLRSY